MQPQDSESEAPPVDDGESDEFVDGTDDQSISAENYFYMEKHASEHQLRQHMRAFIVDY